MLPCHAQSPQKTKVIQPRRAAVRLFPAAACALLCTAAWAGRPLTVDDANVDDAGHGHVEAWAARAPGAKAYNLAPAYAPVDGVELGALLARDTAAATSLRGLQAKWRITPSQENGCNAGAVLGWSRETASPHTASLNGLLTCRSAQRGNVHMNLGAMKAAGTTARANWGVAFERDLESVTPSIEWFGGQGAKRTLQAGLRGNIASNLQLDGSVGRRGRAMLYTLGTKLQF